MHKEQLTALTQDISNQFASDVDNSTKKSINCWIWWNMCKKFKTWKGNISNWNSWNSTLIDIFLDLQSLTDDLKCVNILDCLRFHLDILKDIILIEGDSISVTVTEAIQHNPIKPGLFQARVSPGRGSFLPAANKSL